MNTNKQSIEAQIRVVEKELEFGYRCGIEYSDIREMCNELKALRAQLETLQAESAARDRIQEAQWIAEAGTSPEKSTDPDFDVFAMDDASQKADWLDRLFTQPSLNFVDAAIETAHDWINRCDEKGILHIARGEVGFDEGGELEVPIGGSFYVFDHTNFHNELGERQMSIVPERVEASKLKELVAVDLAHFYSYALPAHDAAMQDHAERSSAAREWEEADLAMAA